MNNKIIFTDFETGGLEHKIHPITQVGMVVCEPKTFAIIDQYQFFIKPYDNKIITKVALEKSRVTMEEIMQGLDSVKALAKMIEIFKKHSAPQNKPILVGHNFTFDIEFGEDLFLTKSKNIYDFVDRHFWCTQRMMKLYERKQKSDLSYNLTSCCDRFGIKLKAAHGALPDCLATRELFAALMKGFVPSGEKSGVDDELEKPEKSRKHFEMP